MLLTCKNQQTYNSNRQIAIDKYILLCIFMSGNGLVRSVIARNKAQSVPDREINYWKFFGFIHERITEGGRPVSEIFAKKIDFLMNLTNTRNTELGRALNFDASYISRIRSGKRGLPPKQPFLLPAAEYLARRIREGYQREALGKAIGLAGAFPEGEKEAAALLVAWLSEESVESGQSGEKESRTVPGSSVIPESEAEAILSYGNAGKREVVTAFLSELADAGEPVQLLLHSDEDMSWLYEEKSFAAAWAGYLEKIIRNGSRIRIIHSISRDMNEMWEAVQKWMPLYMTTAIEPYYYPRLRDGVYRRTLFVATGHAAVVATSVTGQEAGLNALLHDRDAVTALEQEYAAYLTLCRPLMEISRYGELSGVKVWYEDFRNAAGEKRAFFKDGIAVLIRAGESAMIIKLQEPFAVFRFHDSRMVAAMEEYLSRVDPGSVMEEVLREIDRRLLRD